jgi:hypothetical protein
MTESNINLFSSLFSQINHQLSCSYMSQQNSMVERKHRHIVELALVIMSQSLIPISYWDEIFFDVVFLINRLPTSNSTSSSDMAQCDWVSSWPRPR